MSFSRSRYWLGLRKRIRKLRRLAQLRVVRLNEGVTAPGVIALTSYPARIRRLHWVLRSLLSQSQQRAVILVLSSEQFPGGEAELDRRVRKLIESRSNVLKICWTTDDTRSYKKLVPLWEDRSLRPIITVDDDVLYPPTLVEELVDVANKFPGCVVGTRGQVIEDKSFAYPDDWRAAPRGEASFRHFVNGRGGILYPDGALHDSVTDIETALRLAPNQDDLWFKVASLRAGVKVVVAGPDEEFPDMGGAAVGLYIKNTGDGGGNRRAWRNLCAAVAVRDLLRQGE